jgi:hypothetical protein
MSETLQACFQDQAHSLVEALLACIKDAGGGRYSEETLKERLRMVRCMRLGGVGLLDKPTHHQNLLVVLFVREADNHMKDGQHAAASVIAEVRAFYPELADRLDGVKLQAAIAEWRNRTPKTGSKWEKFARFADSLWSEGRCWQTWRREHGIWSQRLSPLLTCAKKPRRHRLFAA